VDQKIYMQFCAEVSLYGLFTNALSCAGKVTIIVMVNIAAYV